MKFLAEKEQKPIKSEQIVQKNESSYGKSIFKIY